MESAVSKIEKLVNDFYASTDHKETFTEADRLLTSAQNSNEAWTFVWLLLQKDKPPNVQYFGACTLYVKISKHFFELDQNSQIEIRQRIVEFLVSYLDLPGWAFVTTKLISCLSAYAIQTIDSSWPTALSDIVNLIHPEKLSHLPPSRVIHVLLQILNSIPEEFNVIRLEKSKRIAVIAELQKHAPSVLFIVHKVLAEDNISDTITQIGIKCFSKWTQGLNTLVLCENHSNIMAMVLNAVCNENTCHNAVDAIIEVYTCPFIDKYPKLILQLIEQMSNGLETVIAKAITESNLEFCKDLYSLFVNIGQSHTRLLLDSLIDTPIHTNAILKLMQIILKCSSTPGYYGYDEFISDQSFNFWITIQDDIMASEDAKVQTYLSLFAEIYVSLINCLLLKVQYPPDEIYIREWDKDDREKFRCYRQDISDTFIYCFNILRGSMMKTLFSHFTKAVDQVMILTQKDSERADLLTSAKYLEAVLYAFRSIAENIDVVESKYIPQIFASFSTIPFEKISMPRLLETVMNFLSSFSEWICCNLNYLPFTISVISIALKSSNAFVVVSATMALKVITPECQLNLHAYGPQIIALCEEHLNYPNLQYKDKARLMFTLGTVLSIMPMEVIMQTIDRILIPILAEAETILNVGDDDEKVLVHITGILLILANLFSKLDVNLKGTEHEEGDQLVSKTAMLKSAKNNIKPQPLYIIFEKVLPLFGIIASKYGDNDEITENLCECIKKSVITLLDDIQPLINSILQLLLHLYRNSKSIHVLRISRNIFTLFHSVPVHLPQLQDFFLAITQITTEVFQQDFRENTYLVQVFFEESAAILKKSPIICSNPKLQLSPIFNFAISGIVLPEKPTIHQCAVFITEFLNHGRNDEIFHKVISEKFDILVMQIFAVIGGTYGSPNFAVDYMVDIIMALNHKYSDSFSRALNAVIEAEPFPTAFVTREHKITLVKTILTLRNNKRKLKDIVKEFSFRCRGMYGVDNKN